MPTTAPSILAARATIATGPGRRFRTISPSGMSPLALLAALLLHGIVLLGVLYLSRAAPPPPAPPLTIALEVLPALTQASTAAPAEAVTAAAPEAASSPSAPEAVASAQPETAVPVPLAPPVPMPPDAVAQPMPPVTPTVAPSPHPDDRPPEPVAQAAPSEVTAVPPPPMAEVPPTPAPDRTLQPLPHRPLPHPLVRRPAAEQTVSDETAASRTAPGTTSAPAPAAAATISPSWQSQLSAWLQAHKTYPEAAREHGEEGIVALRFTVAPNGRVLAVSLVRGSGSERLDSAAAAMLRDAHVPPVPSVMPQADVTVVVNIRYTLER